MNFIAFDYDSYYEAFMQAVSELVLSLEAATDDNSKQALEMITAMVHSMDVMARVNADYQTNGAEPLTEEEIAQVGDYALSLLEEISMVAANRGLQEAMMSLHQLSIPVALWVAEHRGTLTRLEIVVNAIAAYANALKDKQQLSELCTAIEKIIVATAIDIKQDADAANPMRPWRIINLNWGIVATRSQKTELMEQSFSGIINNIPYDARKFFAEGMQQMSSIGYPENVRAVMKKYYLLLTDTSLRH